jgi:hypothetical protein
VGLDILFEKATSGITTDSIPTLGVTPGYPDTLASQGVYPFQPGETRGFSLNDKSTSYSSAMVTLELALVGPLLSEGTMRPRPFLDLRGQIPMGPNHTLSSSESAYDTILGEVEIIRNGQPTGRFADRPVFASASGEKIILNQEGSWAVGLGMILELPFFTGRVVTIRPSLSYYGERLVYRGSFQSEEFPDPNNPYDRDTQESTGIPVFSASTQVPVTLHGIAPRLGVDTVVGRRGPVEVSVYAQYEARIALNNKTLTQTLPNQIGEGSLRFDFSTDSFSQALGFGLRLRFVGKGLLGAH